MQPTPVTSAGKLLGSYGYGKALIVCGVGLAILAGACTWLYSRFPVP